MRSISVSKRFFFLQNVERAENVLKEVEAHGYKLKSSLRARLISCYVKQKNLSKALEQKALMYAFHKWVGGGVNKKQVEFVIFLKL